MNILLESDFTGADNDPLPPGFVVYEGSASIQANAMQCGVSGSPHVIKSDPARADDLVVVTYQIVDRSLGPTKGYGVLCSDGAGGTMNGLVAGPDDTGGARIWSIIDGVSSEVANGGYWGPSLDGMLIVSVTKPGAHYVITLTTSVDSSSLSYTDTGDVFLAGGDIRFYSDGNSVAVTYAKIEGTAAAATNPGLRFTNMYKPNSAGLVDDFTGADIAVYDTLGGTKLVQSSVDIVGGATTLDSDLVGAVDDVVFVILHWTTTGGEQRCFAGTMTVIDLSA